MTGLKNLIFLDAFSIIMCIFAFISSKSQNTFDKSAKMLIEKLSNTPENSKIIFNDDFITFYIDDNNKTDASYDKLKYVIDSDNLIGIIYDESIAIVKKYDNLDMNTFNDFINKKIK